MGKLKKMKKLALRTRQDADRAQVAADRADEAYRRMAAQLGTEATLGAAPSSASGEKRPSIYTGAPGVTDTPAAAG
ncbi:hypothetical protein [Pseudonocardia spinosispora]|uniref:hypothetical protein n=1 Tax=Pseudonocardia spinosispora TaxID=103441 RepID=UPI0003F63FBB|nr:hypothetical protein [Pseudonocardia spinosispora]